MATANGGIISNAMNTQTTAADPNAPTTNTANSTAPATSSPAPTSDVSNWYRSTLGRDPDQAGLNYWNQQLASGADPSKLYNDFQYAASQNGEAPHAADSVAKANDYTGPTSSNNATPVDEWGTNVLGRALTPQEQQKYSGLLNGTAAGTQSAYQQFLNDNQGSIKNNLDWETASQLNAPTSNQPTLPYTGTASTYQAAQLGTPTQFNVSPNQTVQGQLTGLLDPNNPIIQQARTHALEQANSRGLLNSSIASTGADEAAYAAAIPIATTDAATYNQAAGYNTNESNLFAQQNTNAQNAANQFDSGAQNTLTGQNLASATTLANTGLQTASQQKVAQVQEAAQASFQGASSLSQLSANYQNEIANIGNLNMDAAAKQALQQNIFTAYQNATKALDQKLGIPDTSNLLSFTPASSTGAPADSGKDAKGNPIGTTYDANGNPIPQSAQLTNQI